MKIHPFEPIYDQNSRILILGSYPSIQSVQKGFYYAHPQNRFWKILSKILEVDFLSLSPVEKKEALLKKRVALFDIVYQCEIIGSKDETLTDVMTQDLSGLFGNTKIEKILLNGKKSYELFSKYYPEYLSKAEYVPSTSSANAQYSFDALLKSWKIHF